MKYYTALKPEDVDKRVWCVVIDAWSNGLSNREAAFRASNEGVKVSESDIRRWINDNPDIGALRDRLQMDLTAKAKLNIAKDLEKGVISTSKWYLERKAPEEFSTRSSMAIEGAVIDLSLEEKEKRFADLMKEFRDE